MVRIFTLKNCTHCAEFKDSLSRAGIKYEEIDGDSSHPLVQAVEYLTGSRRYPICDINLTSSRFLLFITEDYSKLKIYKAPVASTYLIGVLDVSSMIKLLKDKIQ